MSAAGTASVSPLLRRLTFANSSLLQPRQLPALHRSIQQPSPFNLRRETSAYLIPLAAVAFSNLQSYLSLLWDSILLAVPKQKTSYGKKRSRQLAGKALQDVTNLNHCSACGRVKRAHILCPYCVALIKSLWKPIASSPAQKTTAKPKGRQDAELNNKTTSGKTTKTRANANPIWFSQPPGKR